MRWDMKRQRRMVSCVFMRLHCWPLLSVPFLFVLSIFATQRCRVHGCVMLNGGESRPYEDCGVLFVHVECADVGSVTAITKRYTKRRFPSYFRRIKHSRSAALSRPLISTVECLENTCSTRWRALCWFSSRNFKFRSLK